MLFDNKPRLFINQDLVFRCHKIFTVDDITHTDHTFEWEINELYEVEYDTSVSTFYQSTQTYDSTLKVIYPDTHHVFHAGEKLVCTWSAGYHSISGIPYTYLDYDVVKYQLPQNSNEIADTWFAEVVQLNEIEYIDYIYGRD